MKDRVMVDIETLGLEREHAILSIGAVRFDRTGLGDRFHEFVDQRSAQAAGMKLDIETLDWHLSQGTFGGRELTDGRELEVALSYFTEWYGDADEVWANSPSFDCEALEYAGDLVDIEMPWHFSEERDVRTVTNLPVASEVEHWGTDHHALDDAVYHAREVAEVLAALEVQA